MQLDGKVAVVTGGANETGRAVALRLATEGAIVVIADVDAERGHATADEISARGGRAAFVATDVTVDGDARRMIAAADQGIGGPHVLVNNAGRWGSANFPDATAEEWGATLDLNLHAAMLATQLALEPMHAAGGGGAVVNDASTAGLDSEPYACHEYGAATCRPDPLPRPRSPTSASA